MAGAVVAALAVTYAVLFISQDRLADPEVYKPVPWQLPAEQADGATEHFSRVLAFPTLSNRDADNHISQPAPFQQLHDYLEREYPEVFTQLEWERVSNYSLLFKWQGTNPVLRPLLVMSHQDVVPAPNDPNRPWTHDPFSGTVAEGFVWGRGALDVKVTLVQILEAVTHLLQRGYTPTRTIYISFGHDEEVGGGCGAASVAALLKTRGVQLELVVDEGGMVLMDGIRPGGFVLVDQPVAIVGTSEKGFETWEMDVMGSGGHSSMPPTDGTSVASRLSKVLATLDANPPASYLVAPTTDWLKALAPAVHFTLVRWLLENADNPLVNPALAQVLAQGRREIAAMVRSTVGVVGLKAGGIAANVLPQSGTITLNFRTLPGHNSTTIREYLSMIARKHAPYASFRLVHDQAIPAPVSPSSGPHYQLIKQVIYETMTPPQGLAAVAPYMLTGGTDSHWFVELAEGRVFRFCPQRFNRTAGDLDMIHGVDERISIEDFHRGIGFYVRLVELAAGDESSSEACSQEACSQE